MKQRTPRPEVPRWDASDEEDRPGPPPMPLNAYHVPDSCDGGWQNPACPLKGVNPLHGCGLVGNSEFCSHV